MTGGQVLTLLTLLIATALFACGAVLAYRIAWNDEFFSWLMVASGKLREADRTVTAGTTIFMAFGGAVALVKGQQKVTGWFVKRELQRVRDTVRDVEIALGPAAAEQYLTYRLQRMQETIAGSGFLNRIFG